MEKTHSIKTNVRVKNILICITLSIAVTLLFLSSSVFWIDNKNIFKTVHIVSCLMALALTGFLVFLLIKYFKGRASLKTSCNIRPNMI